MWDHITLHYSAPAAVILSFLKTHHPSLRSSSSLPSLISCMPLWLAGVLHELVELSNKPLKGTAMQEEEKAKPSAVAYAE